MFLSLLIFYIFILISDFLILIEKILQRYKLSKILKLVDSKKKGSAKLSCKTYIVHFPL